MIAPELQRQTAAHRFALWLAGTAVFVLAVIAGVNGLVDPYWMTGAPRKAGFNYHKPRVYLHMRMAKAHMVGRYQPAAVILGNSRTDQGFEPRHPGWRGRRTFNLGLAGGNMYETLRYFEHALSTSPALEQALLALDLTMFLAGDRNASDFSEARLGRPGASPPWLTDWAAVLVSRGTLSDSRKTLRRQDEIGLARLHREDGMQGYANVAARIRDKGGHRKIFRMVEHSLATRELANPRPQLGASQLAAFRTILQRAQAAKVQLAVLITPTHARDYELLWRAGYWDLFEDFKRTLVRIRDEETGATVPLWDFSGYNRFSMEPLPPEGDVEAKMQWHWETAHFNVQLGDYVLDRVLDYHGPERPPAPDFGVKLSADSVDAHLAGVRRAGGAYRRANATELAELPSEFSSKRR